MRPVAARDESPILRISIDSHRVRLGLAAAAVALLLASALAVSLEAATRYGDGALREVGRFTSFWFGIDNERNLTAWYSSVLLVVVALVAWDLARVERMHRRSPWWAWAFLAVTFAGLSLDELLQMHEQSSVVSLLLTPLIVVVAVASLPLLRALPRRIALQLVGAGALFVGGSLGMELIGTLTGETDQVLIHLEEAAEMLGVAFALAAIAEYREAADADR